MYCFSRFFAINIINSFLFLQIAARYDPEVEAEVREWIKALTGEELPKGMRECEKALRNGRTLVA